MTEIILRLVMSLLSVRDVESLMRTDPADLTEEKARAHIAAARIAGFAESVDPDLLLSIAWHESRYDADAIGPEAGGKVSCGPMTPTPLAKCERKGILEGYSDGAKHLREWVRATSSMRQALLGYAGGYRMIQACAMGPVIRKTGMHDDLCRTPDVFLYRRNWIRNERLKAVRPLS